MANVRLLVTVDQKGAVKNIQQVEAAFGQVDLKAKSTGKNLSAAFSTEINQQARGMAGSLGSMGSVLGSMGPAGLTAAAGMAVTAGAITKVSEALLAATRSAGAWADENEALASDTQMSVEAVFRLREAAAGADLDFGKVAAASTKLQIGLAQNSQAFDDVGLSIDALKQLEPEQALFAVVEQIQAMGDRTERLKAARAIFGKAGEEMLRLSASTAEAADNLGMVWTADRTAAAAAFSDQVDQLDRTWEQFQRNIGLAIAESPELQQALVDVTMAAGALSRMALESGPQIRQLVGEIASPGLTVAIEKWDQLAGVLDMVGANIPRVRELWSAMHGGEPPRVRPPGKPTPSGIPAGPSYRERAAMEEEERRLRKQLAEWEKAQAEAARNEQARRAQNLQLLAADLKEQEKLWDDAVASIVKDVVAVADEEIRLGALLGPSLGEMARQYRELGEAAERAGGIQAMNNAELAEFIGQVEQLLPRAEQLPGVTDAYAAALAAQATRAAEATIEAQALTEALIDALAAASGLPREMVAASLGIETSMRSATDQTVDWREALSDLANLFDVLGGEAGNALADMAAGLDHALATTQRMTDAQGNLVKGWKMMAAQGAVGIFSSGYSSGSAAGGALSGAAQGAIMGSVIPGIGTVAGGLIGGALGAIGGLFGGGKKKREEERKKREEEARQREQLLQEQLSNLESLSGQLDDFIDETVGGGVDSLNAMFARFSDGTEMSQERMDRLGTLGVAVFDQLRERGYSLVDAVEAISPALDQALQSAQAQGLEMSRRFGDLVRFRDLVQQNQGLVTEAESLSGLTASLRSTGEFIGPEGAETFAAIQGETADVAEELAGAGFGQGQILSMLGPQLMQLRDLAEQYGFALDEGTQSLVDQADAAGVFEGLEDPLDRMTELMDLMVQSIAVLTQAFGAELPEAVQEYIDKLNEIPDVTGPAAGAAGASSETPTLPKVGIEDLPVAEFQGGGVVTASASGSTLLTRFHGTEYVVPEDVWDTSKDPSPWLDGRMVDVMNMGQELGDLGSKLDRLVDVMTTVADRPSVEARVSVMSDIQPVVSDRETAVESADKIASALLARVAPSLERAVEQIVQRVMGR